MQFVCISHALSMLSCKLCCSLQLTAVECSAVQHLQSNADSACSCHPVMQPTAAMQLHSSSACCYGTAAVVSAALQTPQSKQG
jgi:hypothetical protein